MPVVCEECDRAFETKRALKQHMRDSPAHSNTFDCNECDRSFNTKEALQQHTRDSPTHSNTFDCNECNRAFNTEEALQQHTRDSPAHSNTFNCDDCDRAFITEQALQQHVRDSPLHTAHEDGEEADLSFDMRPSLHRDVSNLLHEYGLSFEFAPIDDPHDFLEEFDTSIMGTFTCNSDMCVKRRWTSKKIAITIRQLSGLRYNARVYYQQCESCGSLSRPALDNSYAERVSYRLAKWSGIAVQEAPRSGRSKRPHQSNLCAGCRHGRCR